MKLIRWHRRAIRFRANHGSRSWCASAGV
jgi:hypothetical protein